MFAWNIAKSAEAMFSGWAIKHVCKFLLKKKLGEFILGDIDLDQLDVQLGAGTIELSDLALNVDYINQKFGEAALIVKEGSIGSLLVRIPWKGKSCQIEVDELELLLAPRSSIDVPSVCETSISSQDDSHCASHFVEKVENDFVKQDSVSISLDVHEGVKTIAKMVKLLLTSFHVKLKRIIVAYDPSSERDEKRYGSNTSLVLRIAEAECGTCISEDSDSNFDARVENLLDMSCLTNFVRFEGAMIELLQMDDMVSQTQLPCPSEANFGEWYSGNCPSKVTTPVLTGDSGGFSGTLKLSIPWKNGSLDIRKVDADVSFDPMELKLQPSTIKRLICLWESLKDLDKDGKSCMQRKAKDSVCLNSASQMYSSVLGSAAIATDTVTPSSEGFSAGLFSLVNQGVTDALLPESHFIPDWVPSSIKKNQKDLAEAEPDFGASIDQFFECFDGMRNSQSALGNSGMWNWTCSVFTAISAASSLASGSLYIPSEQQHIETNLKATVTVISVVLSFNDAEHKYTSDLKDNHANAGINVHYLGAKFRDLLLVFQIRPQETKCEAWLKNVELDDYFSNLKVAVDGGCFGNQNSTPEETLLNQHLQAEVQNALPPFPSPKQDSSSDKSVEGMVNAHFPSNLDPVNGSKDESNCKTILRDGLVKISLLKTSAVSNLYLLVKSNALDDHTTGSTTFSLEVPPFISWVDFNLVKMLLDLIKEVGDSDSFEGNDMKKDLGSNAGTKKIDFPCQGEVKSESFPHVTTLSQKGSLQGSVFLPSARVILCFPFMNHGDFACYSSWDQFIALDLSPPLSSKKVEDVHPIPDASSQKGCFPTASCSICLNIGNLESYFIVPKCRDIAENKSYRTYSAQNILSVTNATGCLSGISLFWQEGSVTGPWIATRARSLATSEDSKSSRNERVGKGCDSASVTAVKYLDNSSNHTRQDMILSSTFFLYAHLSTVQINLCSSQYKGVHYLLHQVMNGLCSGNPDANANPSVKDVSASQTSFLLECDSVEILIRLDRMEKIEGSLQKELPGSWNSLRLTVQKFEAQSVSNMGGISSASFIWVGHGEGLLWGSITGYPNQELLLISCSNSTMRRGDGEGANALSSGLAGSSIVYLYDPQCHKISTSITVRCGTVVAPGGRLDWFNSISSFFTLPSPDHEQAGHNDLQEGFSEEHASFVSSFVLCLVDIALSYEPHTNNLAINSGILESDFNSFVKINEETGKQFVACLLAAASLNLSNMSLADSLDSDYKIRVQDLGLLLCESSGSKNVSGTYSVDHLRKIGYVKVAGDALIEAILRTNCKSGLQWEMECSESLINLDTCHDTSSGLICLASQLQQLFAPDMEESIVHLQNRWNNVKQAQASHDGINETKTFDNSSALSPSPVHGSIVDGNCGSGAVGLMDEICEDAFPPNGYRTSPSHSCESCFHISLNEGFIGEPCNLDISTTETSHTFPSLGSMPGTELESNQISFLQKDCFPEFIEGYYLSELRPLSEISRSNQSCNESRKCKSKYEGRGDVRIGGSGWYQDNSLRIVENHISKLNEHLGQKEFLGDGKLPPMNSTGPDNFCNARGRLLLKNIDIRWRMYAGSDWHGTWKNAQQTASTSGRDAITCLELALSGMNLQYDQFPDGEIYVSKISLSVNDFNLYDNSRDAPWKLVLGYYRSKDHPRESSAKAVNLDLESIRPDLLTPLEEYRMRLAVHPLLLHLHQGQLDFLTSFFRAKSSSIDQSPSISDDIDGSRMSTMKNSAFGYHSIAEEALLPYFQKFDIYPVLVRVDYSPCRVDLAALRGGKYVELVNLVPWKGVELHLKHVHAVGVYGWNSVCETIAGEWLEDISQNQIHKLLKGLPTIRSMLAVGSGASKLVSLPVKSYRKDHKLLKGIQRGAIAFVRSISLEAVGLGVHLAAGANDILLQTEYILTSIPPSVPCSSRNTTRTNVRFNQPNDAQQGMQQACEFLSDGLGRSASALVGTPFKTYQRGAGAGSALASAVCAAPVAAIAPASAAARALHCALLGVRNSLDPEHKKESMEKYFGPSQHKGQS